MEKNQFHCYLYHARYELLAQMAGSYWTNEETKALLRIWGAANVQAQLNVVSRKKVVYERVGFYW